MKQTVVLDLDDFSVLRSRWNLLLKLKEHFPKLKLSLFTIPFDYEFESVHQYRIVRDKELQKLHDNLEWIEIIPHGLSHFAREFEKADRKTMQMALKAMEAVFKKDAMPYVKGFKAPFWLWNQDVVDVLNEEGWFGATDRNQPDMLKTKRNYIYSHSIDEPFWESKEPLLKLHGHMTLPSKNNIEDCFLNLMKMPSDADFKFVSEVVGGDGA